MMPILESNKSVNRRIYMKTIQATVFLVLLKQHIKNQQRVTENIPFRSFRFRSFTIVDTKKHTFIRS